ncbi:RNA-binding KH domain-containing protein PEPPER-like [Gastrolobium bilobum]|uniref:RNA-binding KH domain-containing protein PEPPER-like n=1 Tax=Gastrolobium bilobum TaxID=150636 RepID=UPI002AB2141D|nr:RNA-binding KH domain-containing protein PEPPER-like [Gastrolobium bilobum]
MATTDPTLNDTAWDLDNDSLSQLPPTPDTSPIAAYDDNLSQEADTATITIPPENIWPGWPGDSVFRLIVPTGKVGSIIGHKGEFINKMCEDTRARIRVLNNAVQTPDRIVLISGKEEPDKAISPAMDAVIKVFKHVFGLSETDNEDSAEFKFCSIRLLVPSTQAITLVENQGSLIKYIHDTTAASVRVLSPDEVRGCATTDERIVEMQGEAFNVLKALEVVVGLLRKFLVDPSVLPLFEKIEVKGNHKEPVTSSHGRLDAVRRPSYPQFGITRSFSSSSSSQQ